MKALLLALFPVFWLAAMPFLGASGTDQLIEKQSISPTLQFSRFGPEQGLPALQVTATGRDSKGFLWVATYSGLYRYDGYRFRRFSHDPDEKNSLSGNRLRSLTIDRKDRIWVGTESNGVSMYDPSENRFYRFGNDPENRADFLGGPTLIIRELADGSMALMVFGDGIARVMPDLQTMIKHRFDTNDASSLSSNHCLAADVDPAGVLWVGCLGGTVHRYDASNMSFDALTAVEQVVPNPVLSRVSVIRFLRDGGMWMGTDRGDLALLEPNSSSLRVLAPGKSPLNLKADFVIAITEDEQGDVWIGHRDQGIDIVNRAVTNSRQLEHNVSNPKSVSSNSIFGVTLDNEGLMWVATNGAGLNAVDLRNTNIDVYVGEPTAPGSFATNSNVWLLTELADGRLLLDSRGTQPGLFRFEEGRFVLDQELDLVPGDDSPFWLVSALQAKDGKLWLPTVGRGLFVYDLIEDTAKLLPGTEGWNLVTIFEDSQGRLWVSEFSRGLFLIDPVSHELTSFFKYIPSARDIGLGLVMRMLETPDKAIWLGSREGLFRYLPTDESLVRIVSEDSQSGRNRLQNARSVLLDRKGRLWLVGDQIAYTPEPHAENPRFIFPFDRTAVGAQAATAIVEDDRGRIWLSVPAGLLGFDPATNTSVLVEVPAGAPGEVPDGGAFSMREGLVAFSSPRKLTLIQPALFEQTHHIKAPEITRLMIGGREVLGRFAADQHGGASASRTIVVSPEDEDFTVEYASLTPISAQSYRYAHKLEGFNRDWIETDASRRTATYTNLAPGTYQLLMKAFDSNGRSNQLPSELTIKVLPAFYQTSWFRFLAVALLLAILFGAYRTRIAVMQANQQKLERQVKERTAKIESQRSELAERNAKIERTMSELKETQGKLIQSEKLAALGGVVAGVAHEVNTPIGLVVSGASQIEDEVGKISAKVDDNKITKSELQRFLSVSADLGRLTLKNAQRAAELIKSFKRISADQTSQQLAEIEIFEYLQDVVTSLKPLLTETGHQVLVEGDDEIAIRSNPGTLGQVVTNLVTNAVSHAFDDGEIGTITIAVKPEPSGVELTVRDNGCGIPVANRERVFEPFFTTKRGKGNTGLGLHIVHNMVVGALEGSIELQESADGGALFLMMIPDMKKN